MRQLYTILCLFFCFAFSATAQDNFLKDYAPVAPTPASLGKYGDIPVSYHTGLPDISIPIYTLNEGAVSMAIGLSYHASGIRVQETASWVGLGWALNAGGVITRTVQGAPDEKGSSGNFDQSWGWYANKGSGRYVNGVCVEPGRISDGTIDTEPDIFNFNVGGFAGKFFYDSDTIIRIVSQEDLKIHTTSIGNELFSGWIIVDPQGNRYHFGATNASMLMSDYVEQSVYTDDPFAKPKNSSWYLSKIESADRKDVITFTYVEEKYSFWDVSTTPKAGGKITTLFPGPCDGATVRKPTRARIKGKRLSSITGTNGSVVFTGDANVRTDLSRYDYCAGSCSTVNTEAKALKTIEIRAKDGSCLKQFELATGYTPNAPIGSLPASLLPDGNDSTDRRRLVLNTLTEKACGSPSNNKVHTFEYNDLGAMPRRISLAQDHWGYYNGKDSNLDLDPGMPYYKRVCNGCLDNYNHACTTPPNKREPAFPAMRNGTIKKITYPTGGTSIFDFEAHTVWDDDSTCVEATIVNWSAFGGGNCTNCTNCSTAFSERTNSFTQAQIDNGHISITIGNSCLSNSANIEVYNPSNQLVTSISGNGFWYLKAMNGVALQAGVSYRFKLNMQGSDPAFARIYTITRNVFKTNKIIGGLRIKTITTNDGDSDPSNNIIKNFEYVHPVFGGGQTSGKLIHLPIYKALFEFTYFSDSILPSNCNWPLTNGYATPDVCPVNGINPIVHLVIHNSALQPMQTTMGSHIGYIGVQVKETNNGKTEYRYNLGNYENGPWKPTGYPFPPPPYEPLMGKLQYETHYNQSGTPQKTIEYEYLVSTTNAISGYGACKTAKLDLTPSFLIAVQFYDLKTGYALTNKIMERNFNVDGTYQEKLTQIGYTPANGHLQKTTEDVTDADGSIYRTKYKYVRDYYCATDTCDESNSIDLQAKAIYAMRDRNMVSIPIEQTTWLKRPSWGAFRLTGASYFQFDKVNTNYNNIKLKTVHQVRTATPETAFTESSISVAGVFSKHDAKYSQEYNFRFSDTHGKILSQWKQNDPAKQQYIWSHNNKLPTAKIINAEDTEVAFTSFEQQDIAFQGNWTFSGAGGGWSNTVGDFMTGRVGFNLSPARTIAKNNLPTGKYLVSGWHKDGSFIVNGITVSTSSGGQWKYAEKEITLASPGNITVSSGGSDWGQYIDELRVCPSDALMRTFSYDDRNQLLLSIADENGVPAHYDFDTWQRLQAVRDQDRNILQTYEYNYQQAGAALNDIKARTALVTGKTTVAQVNALVGAEVRRVFQYMDGLGRPIQTNEIAQSPAKKDIINYQAYNAYGQETKKYIPYTFTSNGGTYRTGAAAEQLTFVNTFGAGGFGYSETKFESSPLNRPSEQAAPGDAWRIGNGHTMEYAYRGNTVADAVRNFTGNATFAINLLWVTQETDENERKKWTFTDKLGRIVLVKQELNATETGQTYTVYDDFGRVLCVIPPETTKRMINSGNWDYNHATYASMIFKYVYDNRGRMTSKTVPSGGTTSIAYDRLDRPVLSTDPKSFKVFTRYDILSRPVVSGKYKGVGVPGAADPLFETSNTTAPHYYTSTCFPTDNNLDVYKVLYYDDYDLDNNGSLGATETYTDPAEAGYDATAFLRTRGKPTASKVGILLNSGLAPTTFLTTRTYYDKEYSVIQVNKQNHLGGSDIISNAYDFANRVTKTRRNHTATPPGGALQTHTIREEYVYDEASRLRFTRHKINANNWVVTSAPLYDELSRLQDKRLHASNYDGVSAVTLNSVFNYLQSLDYSYNIRGWLTGINDPTSCAVQGGDQLADLFIMGLDYESIANGATAQYNGNISAMQWRSNVNGSCMIRQQYRFTYDFSNRLLSANHFTHNGTAWVNTNNYSESSIAYDLNGNIKTYTRRGQMPDLSFNVIDNLTYTYGDAARPDRLTNVSDAGNAVKGFKFTAGAAAYAYDLNGNLTQDNHKSLTLAYNYLNLPNFIVDPGGAEITLTYTADGEKLTKLSPAGTQNYVSGIEYLGNALDAIYHSEGRCTPNGATAFHYEYTIKDHLGNARINFRANGAAVTFLQELHYYPFGMLMEGIGTAKVTNNGYKYNGKELNEDLGLNWLDFNMRWYDPALGRFPGIDKLADTFNFVTPYNYAENEPVGHIDLWGLQKYKPQIQPIEKPSDLLSTKMLNNAYEGIKAMGREFLTEPVGQLMKDAGDALGKAGILVSPEAPPVGGALMILGEGMEIAGTGIIATDQALSSGKVTKEAAINFAIDLGFAVLPKEVEKIMSKSDGDKAVKEATIFAINAVTEVVKDKVEENVPKSNQK